MKPPNHPVPLFTSNEPCKGCEECLESEGAYYHRISDEIEHSIFLADVREFRNLLIDYKVPLWLSLTDWRQHKNDWEEFFAHPSAQRSHGLLD